jgi:hypothetical protein
MAKIIKTTAKYKLTLSLDHDFARRFAAYSGLLGEDQSDIATRALRREMRGFSCRRVVEGDVEADGPEGPAVRLARSEDQREAG